MTAGIRPALRTARDGPVPALSRFSATIFTTSLIGRLLGPRHGVTNRLDTELSVAIRRIASAISGATETTRIFAVTRIASVA